MCCNDAQQIINKPLIFTLSAGYVSWLRVLIVVVIIAFLTGVLFFAQKKPVMFRY